MNKLIIFVLILFPSILNAQHIRKLETGELKINVEAQNSERITGTDKFIKIPYINGDTSIKYSFEETTEEDDDTAVIYCRIKIDPKIRNLKNVNHSGLHALKNDSPDNIPAAITFFQDDKKNYFTEFLVPVKKHHKGYVTLTFALNPSLKGQPISTMIEFKYYKMPEWRIFLYKHGVEFTSILFALAPFGYSVATTASITVIKWLPTAAGIIMGHEVGKELGSKLESLAYETIREIQKKYKGVDIGEPIPADFFIQ